MTRQDQKAAERATLDMLLSALAITPESIVPGEAPDFAVTIRARSIGVEVTMYQTGSIAGAGIGRRQVESEWEVLEKAARSFQATQPDLRRINVGLMFKSIAPARKEHPAFMAEITDFVRAHAPELTPKDVDFWPLQFTSPLMKKYLRTLIVRTDEYATWYSNITAGWVARPDATLAQIVAEKAAKTYRPTDELWLAIQCSHRISETVLPMEGAADFAAVPELDAALTKAPFAKAYVLAIGGLYEWDRSAGWINRAPSQARARGPSLVELKATLRDPEWLADPLGKADKVAKEVLEEIRGKGTY
jgi:hypothetical protein